MHGAILGESSPPSSKEMTEKSDGSAPKKLPYFGEGGEVEFVQRKEVEEEAESEEEALDDDFSLLITKWWPFRLLKTLNLLLLLALLRLCAVDNNNKGIDSSLRWSRLWENHSNFEYYYDQVRPMLILVLMAVASLIAQRRWSKHSSAGGLAIMDLCFALIFLFNLLYIGGFFGIRFFLEYRWFVPRLNKLYGTTDGLVGFAEWTPRPRHYWRNDWTTTRTPWHNSPSWRFSRTTTSATMITTPASPTDSDWQLMRMMDAIRARLLMDLAIVTLSVLATLMNAVMAFIIWKTIKRSRCLCANNNNANGRRRRRRQVPDATSADGESEQQTVAAALAFARLWPIGFVKLLLTSITTVLVFFSFHGRFHGPWMLRPLYAVLGVACLANWIFYLQKAWLSGDKRQQENVMELNNFRKKDCLFNYAGAVACLLAYVVGGYYSIVLPYIHGILIALFLFGPVRNFCLYQYNKVGSQNGGDERNVPLISIKVQIDTGNDKHQEKKMKKKAEELKEVKVVEDAEK